MPSTSQEDRARRMSGLSSSRVTETGVRRAPAQMGAVRAHVSPHRSAVVKWPKMKSFLACAGRRTSERRRPGHCSPLGARRSWVRGVSAPVEVVEADDDLVSERAVRSSYVLAKCDLLLTMTHLGWPHRQPWCEALAHRENPLRCLILHGPNRDRVSRRSLAGLGCRGTQETLVGFGGGPSAEHQGQREHGHDLLRARA